MLNRKQFREHWKTIDVDLVSDTGPMWAMENRAGYRPSRWFVSIPNHGPRWNGHKAEYWLWCNKHCAGQILCYSSSSEKSWWGFTHRADIVLWLLKWG